jgi:hypothetical protein
MTTKYFNVKHGITTGDILLDAETGNITATNANLGNLATANFFTGDAYKLANLTGANVTGFVPNAVHANTANTVTTAAQPNITSVGTLLSANVSGNLVAANVKANTMLTTSDLTITGKITGDLIPSANLGYDIGSSTYLWKDLWLSGSTIHLGAATISATSSGTIVASGDSNVSGNLNVSGDSTLGNTATANYFIGKFDSSSSNQANITNVGTLGNLTVSGNVSTGGIKTDNYYYANGSPVDFQQTAGSTGALQYNNNGDFGASANLTWNNGTSTLEVDGTISVTAVEATTVQGSLTTASQPNITSVGTLSSLVVSANANVGNINSSGTGYISGNLDAGNVTTGGVLKTTSTTNASGTGTGALIVAGGASISKDLYVAGNLYVPNIVSTSSVTLTVEDPLLYLSANTTFPYDYDIGFYSAFSTGAANAGYQHTGLFRNHADSAWYLVSNVGEPTGGTADLSNANVVFDAFKTGNIDVTGTITVSVNANVTGNIKSGNANLGNAATANYFIGSGANLTNIPGANVSGNVANANLAGYVTQAAQSNITSVGTLTSLGVNGTLTAKDITANTGVFTGNANGLNNIPGANVTGTVPNANMAAYAGNITLAAQSNITSVGTLTSLTVAGNISAGNIDGGNLVEANYFSGVIAASSSSQPNISSVGSLTSLDVLGNIDTGANINVDGEVIAVGNITAPYFIGNVQGNISGTLTAPGSNTQMLFNDAGNINGSAKVTFNKDTNVFAVTGNITSSNANLGNAATANFFIGDGYKLGNITGANVTGYVANADWSNSATVATTAGTVTTNAQPNITSVGTLTSLVVSGLTTTTTLKVTGGFTSDRSPVTVSGNTVIDQFPTGSYRTAKYVVTANADDGYQSVEALLVHNDVGSYITIYGSISSGATDVIDLTTSVDGVSGNVRLYASNASPNAHVNLVATYV